MKEEDSVPLEPLTEIVPKSKTDSDQERLIISEREGGGENGLLNAGVCKLYCTHVIVIQCNLHVHA